MFAALAVGIIPLTWHAQRADIFVQPWHWLCMPLCALFGALTGHIWGKWGVFLAVTSITLLAIGSTSRKLFVIFCGLCAYSAGINVVLSYNRYTTLTHILSEKPHNITAVVTTISPWHSKHNGSIITLAVSEVSGQPMPCTIRCYLYTQTRLNVGNAVRIQNVQLQHPPSSHHLFMYSLRDNIAGSFFAPFLRYRIEKSCAPGYKWYSAWHQYRDSLYQQCKSLLSDDTFIYFSALFLGNKNSSGYAQTRRQFALWGITHYLARSGLHIALLAMLCTLFLTIIPVPFFIRKIMLLCLLLSYSALSWSSISFLRSLLLWMLYIIGSLLQLPSSPLHLFSFVTLFLILHNPIHIFCLDFQLSFFLSGVLMIINYLKAQKFLLASCATK